LWIFIVASVVRRVLDPAGTAGGVLQLIATSGPLWWAADEVLRGVNPWRRMLGGGMLVAQLVKLLAP
jgi:hypothetical protein